MRITTIVKQPRQVSHGTLRTHVLSDPYNVPSPCYLLLSITSPANVISRETPVQSVPQVTSVHLLTLLPVQAERKLN